MAPSTPAATKAPVVLIVDDEEDILVSLASVLEEYLPNARIVPCHSARQAQLLLREHAPRVVVSDFRMPGMNGLELLADVRDSSDAARMLMTAYPATGLMVRAVNEAGVQGIFVKPFDAMKMVESIREVLAEEMRAN